MDHTKEIQRLEQDLAAAQETANRAGYTDARPEANRRIGEIRYKLDQTRQMAREATARAATSAAQAAPDALEVGVRLTALRDQRRACPTPTAQAAFDDRHGAEYAALETRLDALTVPPADAPAPDAAVAARAEYVRLSNVNPIAAASMLERMGPGVLPTGGT
jgi:hypothetical protein